MPALLATAKARFLDTPAGQGRVVEVQAAEGDLVVDGGRLGQVLLNLLSNAGEASPADTPISLLGTVDGEHYCIEVRDAGVGIEESLRQLVFEPFFSKRRGGSGLGLAVCLGIVRAHEGTIQVVDTPSGEGAAIRVQLPLVATPADPPRLTS